MSATEAFETTNSSIDDQEEGYIELLDESCVMPSEGWTTNEMVLFEGTVEQLKGTKQTVPLMWWNKQTRSVYRSTHIIDDTYILIDDDDVVIA